MGEEENNFNIHDFLYEMNSKKNNQFQPNNIFINNYNNNLTRNKSDNIFQNKSHKINNDNIPKELELNNLNNKFKGNIFKINYNPVNLGYNRDINPDYHFSENNYFQPNIINTKMINDISSNIFEYENKYHNLNNLNKNRIFSSEKKPNGIMDKYKNKILLKNEKERIRHKKEDDIKDLDNEENNFYLRPISGKEKLLKNLNNEIEKIDRLINAKKLEKTRRRLEKGKILLEKIKLEDIKEEERERIENERRKKEEERLIKEYFIREEERKRKELEQKRIEEERKRIEEERERKRIIEENRRKTKLAEIKKNLERIIQRMEENKENKFNLFNRLNMNYHHMSNINYILNKSINMNSNMDGSIINNMNNNMNGSIINNINSSNMNNNMDNNNMNSNNMNNNMNNNNINSNNINNNMDNNNNNMNRNNMNTNMNNNNMNSNNINTNNNSIINNSLIDESIITNETLSLNFSNDLNEREIELHEEVDLNRFYMRNNNNINNLVGPIKKILNALPENRIDDVNKLNEENRKCLICLEEYINNDNIIYLPCFHIFHKKCIIPWIKTHAICPLCKINIIEIIK